MTIQLLEHALIQWHNHTENPTIERVLFVDHVSSKVLLFDISIRKPYAFPVWKSYQEVVEALNGKQGHILNDDPFEKLITRNEDDISETYKQRRDRAWNVIKPLLFDDHGMLRFELYDPQERHALLSTAAKQYASTLAANQEATEVEGEDNSFALSSEARRPEDAVNQEDENTKHAKKVLIEWLRKAWRGKLRPNALLPYWHLCGAKPGGQRNIKKKLGRPSAESRRQKQPLGVNIDAHLQDLLIQGYQKFFDPKQHYPWKFAYLQTMSLFFNDGHELSQGGVYVPILKPAHLRPSPPQFKYYAKKALNTNYVNELKRLFGVSTFNLKHRPLLGNSTQMAYGPMSVYQVDAWVGDIYLVSALNRKWLIGRPIVYIIIDVFSRMIVGFSVGLEGPSWVDAMLALQNVVEDKVAFCKEYGIDITPEMWPTAGFPRALIADRGEFEGYNASTLENAFGVRIANTAPYRGDLKAIVERDFLTIKNLTVQFIPGQVHHLRERGGKDYRLDACLTLSEFRQVLIRHIIYHNNAWRMQHYRMDEFAIHDDVPPYPIRLWNWGIENRVGALREQPTPEQVQLGLLPRGKASTTPQGLLFENLHYNIDFPDDEEGKLAEELFVRARVEGRKQVTVAHNHRRIKTIYLCADEGRRLVPCHLLPSETSFYGRDLDLYDVQYYFGKQKSDVSEARTADEQAIVTLHAENEATIRHAQEQTKSAREGQTNTERLRDIREHRKHEQEVEQQREEQRQTKPSTQHVQTDTPSAATSNTHNSSRYVPPPQPNEMLESLFDDDGENT